MPGIMDPLEFEGAGWFTTGLCLELGVGLVLGLATGLDLGLATGLDLGLATGLDLGFATGLDLGLATGLDLGVACFSTVATGREAASLYTVTRSSQFSGNAEIPAVSRAT